MMGSRISLLSLIFLTSTCAFAAEPGNRIDVDWPQWRGPRGDGTWRAPKIAEAFPEGGLKTVWEKKIGGGYAGVIVADGRCLVMDRFIREADEQANQPKQELERVLCFDAATGKPLWEHTYDQPYGDLDYGNGPRSAPTVHGRRVLTLGALGQLKCLSLATGEVHWSHDLVSEFNGRPPMWGYAASPLVFDEAVIVAGGGDNGQSLLAFELDDGSLRWKTLSDKAAYAWPIPVERDDHTQLVCWTPSHIRSVDSKNGKPLWAVPYEVTYGVSIATPIVHDDTVLVCAYWAGSKAIRLGRQPQDAELLWEENRYLRGLMSQPLYRDGFVYLLDKQYGITCFELQTGKKRWDDGNGLTPRGRNPQASLVWLGNTGRIIALNSEGELVLAEVNPDGFREQSRTKIIDATWAHPAYAGYRVFARSDERIVCVELPAAD